LNTLPNARTEKILNVSKQKKEFTIQDVIKILPDVPRRTLERDLEFFVKQKILKTKGDKKARTYRR
jgi:hypothetical protein